MNERRIEIGRQAQSRVNESMRLLREAKDLYCEIGIDKRTIKSIFRCNIDSVLADGEAKQAGVDPDGE